MILYHFTALEYLDSIRAEGLSKGEVPLTQTATLNAVWLTSDRRPEGHGLTDGRELTMSDKRFFGLPVDQPAFFPNKRALRLTVRVPRNDRNLVHWPAWGKKRLTPDWYATLDKVGHGKSRSWFLYWGTIPTDWITSVDDLRADRGAS